MKLIFYILTFCSLNVFAQTDSTKRFLSVGLNTHVIILNHANMSASNFKQFIADEEFLTIHPQAKQTVSNRMYSRQSFGGAVSFLATKHKKMNWLAFNTINLNACYSAGEHLSFDYYHEEQIRGDSVWLNSSGESELYFNDSIKYEHSTLGSTFRSVGVGLSYFFTYQLSGVKLMIGPAFDYNFTLSHSVFLSQTKSYETGLFKEGQSQPSFVESNSDGSESNGKVNTLNYTSFDTRFAEVGRIQQLYLHLPFIFESRFSAKGGWENVGIQIHGGIGYQWIFWPNVAASGSAKYSIGLGLNYYL